MYFPFFQDISDKKILIIGGGETAEQKLSALLKFSDNVTVIAQSFCFDYEKNTVKKFEDSDLDGFDIVVCATDDRTLNGHIAELCREKNIPVNCVDDIDNCSFIFPSVIKKGSLTIAISTGGKAPLVCKTIRRKTEQIIPDDIDIIIENLSRYREELKNSGISYEERSAMLRERLEELW